MEALRLAMHNEEEPSVLQYLGQDEEIEFIRDCFSYQVRDW